MDYAYELRMAKELADKNLPTISVITPSYSGSLSVLEKCLDGVRKQNYPQSKIEIVLGHGGTREEIAHIIKKYDANVFLVPKNKQNAEYNRGIAFSKSKNELVLVLDHDNFFPSKNWLREMVAPLLKHKELVGVNTCYYHYDKSYPMMDRYFALFGTSEPLPYFLHKADRMPQTAHSWVLNGEAEDYGNYYYVTFSKDPRKFPSIGTNGCLMRRKLVAANSQSDPNHHYPIDVLFDVAQSGYSQYAYVKNSIIHLTHSRGFAEFIKRKLLFVKKYHFEDHSKRRWSVVVPGDELGVFLFVVYSLTLVLPLYDSLKGYLKIRDVAWFMHPLMCLGTTFIYGYMTIQFGLKKTLSFLRRQESN